MDHQAENDATRSVSVAYPNSANVEFRQVSMPPGWMERGWCVEKVGNGECLVFDGRANIEKVRKNLNPIHSRRSCLAALMHGIQGLLDRR